jgi:hypothetical protein
MYKFKVTVGAHVTIYEERTFEVRANDMEEAETIARGKFDDAMEEKYPWCDYDTIHINEIKGE